MSSLPSLAEEQRRADLLIKLALQHGVKLPNSEIARGSVEAASMWKNRQPPLPFDLYCRVVGKIDLFPRQAQILLPHECHPVNLMRAENFFSARRSISQWHLIWGKGSGKDMLVSLFFTWLVYCLCQFRENPRTVFSRISGRQIAESTSIDIVNVSTSGEQALQVFFGYCKKWLASPLFSGIPTYPPIAKAKPGTNKIVFPEHDVNLYSKTSKAMASEGFNTWAFALDEADAMQNAQGDSNAQSLYNTLRRTAVGRWGKCAVGVNISYARLEEGFMLLREAQFRELNAQLLGEGHRPIYYIDKAGTAEVRPDFDPRSPDIVAEYRADPISARAMYENIPMAASFTFFDDPRRVLDLTDDSRPYVAMITHDTTKTKLENGRELEYVFASASSFRPEPGCIYFLSIDGGVSGDSYAVCLGHIDHGGIAAAWLCPSCGAYDEARELAPYVQVTDVAVDPSFGEVRCGMCERNVVEASPLSMMRGWWQKQTRDAQELIINGKKFHLPHWYEDLIIEVAPRRAEQSGERDAQVSLGHMASLCRDLIQGLSIQQTRADPWQAIQLVQGLQMETGTDVDTLSMSNPEQVFRARIFKGMLNQNMMTFRPSDKGAKEIRQLQMLNASRIDHPDGGSKDLYDARSMNVYMAADYHCQRLGYVLSAS